MLQNTVLRNNFEISNRKYIGSKANLLDQILKHVIERVGIVRSFADIFAGTGVVAAGIQSVFPQTRLILNDTLYANYVSHQAFFGCTEDSVNNDKVRDIIGECNQMPGYYGYATHNFGGSYFTVRNAKIIDQARDRIEHLYQIRSITFKEKCILLASLLYAADKVANTCGQYDSYLKHIGSETFEDGRHKVDSNVYKRIDMKMPNLSLQTNEHIIVSMDSNILIEHIHPQVLYLDPPYNTRQYIDNYHVLENIAKWEKPELFGKTKKFRRDSQKSRFSQKRYVEFVFQSLIKNSRAEHIFLSYNSEGLLSADQIISVLEKKGNVETIRMPYNVFGNGAGQARKRQVTEYLFYVKVA